MLMLNILFGCVVLKLNIIQRANICSLQACNYIFFYQMIVHFFHLCCIVALYIYIKLA